MSPSFTTPSSANTSSVRDGSGSDPATQLPSTSCSSKASANCPSPSAMSQAFTCDGLHCSGSPPGGMTDTVPRYASSDSLLRQVPFKAFIAATHVTLICQQLHHEPRASNAQHGSHSPYLPLTSAVVQLVTVAGGCWPPFLSTGAVGTAAATHPRGWRGHGPALGSAPSSPPCAPQSRTCCCVARVSWRARPNSTLPQPRANQTPVSKTEFVGSNHGNTDLPDHHWPGYPPWCRPCALNHPSTRLPGLAYVRLAAGDWTKCCLRQPRGPGNAAAKTYFIARVS